MYKVAFGWGASALALFLSLSASGAEVGTYFTQPPGGAYEVEVPGAAGIQVSSDRLRMMADPRGSRGESSAIELVFEGAAGSPLQPKQRIEGDLIYWYSGAIGDPAVAVPRFAALEQKDFHPGIDLGVTLERGRIEKRFSLAKGADLSELRMRVRTRGSQPVLTSSGALRVGDVLFQPTGAAFITLGEDLFGLAAAGAVSEVELSIDYAAWLAEARSAPQPRLADHPKLLAQLPGAQPGDLLVFRTGTPPAPALAAEPAAKAGLAVFTGGDYACASIVLGPGDTLDPSGGAFTNVLALVVPAGVTATVAPGGSLLDVTAAYVRIDGTLDLRGAGATGGPSVPGTGPGVVGQGPGGGQGGSGAGFFNEVAGSGGGGYGGIGGAGGAGDAGGTPGAGGATYGMSLPPGIELGSGGASGVAYAGPSGAGGAGGGALELLGNDIRIGGLIRADGAGGGNEGAGADAAGGGGGAGGGVLLEASRTLFGNGTVAARGGGAGVSDDFAGGSGGGAGGRIKFTGALDPGSTITPLVGGGGGASSFFASAGAAGGPGSVDTSTTTAPNPGGANVTVCSDTVAELRLTKTVDNPVVSVGDTVVYTLLVENIGFTTATGINVTDALPAGMNAVSTSGCSNDPNGGATCQLADLAPGASTNYTLTATVVLDPGHGMTDTITNTAVVNLAETDPNPADSQSSVVVTVLGDPLLTLTKAGPPTAIAGQTVTYTIEVTNGGPQDALGVVIDDTPPTGLSFSSATAPCAGGFPCAIGTLADGASVQFDVTFNIAPNALGDVTNTANVTASNIAVPDPTVNSGSATTTIQAVADLSITKADSVDPVVAGTPLSYTITVSNVGPSDATAVTVADTLPAGVTLVSTAGCAEDPSGAPACTLGTIAVGTMAAYTINVIVNPATPAGVIQNTAVVSSAAFDPNTLNNSVSESTTVETLADLSITKTNGVASSTPGTDTVYTITASNVGPSNAPGSTVADTFPAACVGVTWTCIGAGGATCTANGAGNINEVVNLPAAGNVTYSATCPINPAAVGTLDNTATVAVAGGVIDPNGANNSASDSDTLEASADLSITKTNGVTSSTPGTDTVYTIVASNAGSSDAPGSVVTDTFPAACVGVTWTCIGAGGATCTANGAGNINEVVNLPAAGSVTYSATCPIDPAAVGTLDNTATVAVAGGVIDPNGANNSATDSDVLAAGADLSISKTNGVAASTPGTSTVYTIVASNPGPSDAPASAVVDVFPAACSSVAWTCVGSGGGACTAAGTGNINDSVDLPSGASVTYTANCAIDAAAVGNLVNTATVSAPVDVTDSDPANNSATDTDALTGQADLSVALSDTVDPVAPAAALGYSATLSNAGPSSAVDVTLELVLDPDTGFVSVLPSAGANCTTPAVGSSGAVSCTWIGATAIAQTRSFDVSVNVAPSALGTLSATASASSPTADPSPANNSVSEITTLSTGTADLALTLTAMPTTIGITDVVTLTAAGNNTGPADAQDVQIQIVLPATLGFASVMPGPGGTCVTPAIGASGAVVCSYAGPTPVGATRTVVVTATPLAGGEAFVTASAVAATSDPSPANAQAATSVMVNTAPVTVEPVIVPALELRTLLWLALMMAVMGWFALRHER